MCADFVRPELGVVMGAKEGNSARRLARSGLDEFFSRFAFFCRQHPMLSASISMSVARGDRQDGGGDEPGDGAVRSVRADGAVR